MSLLVFKMQEEKYVFLILEWGSTKKIEPKQSEMLSTILGWCEDLIDSMRQWKCKYISTQDVLTYI